MNIARALRLDSNPASNQTVSLVGAGGKSTALFQLARQLLSTSASVIITATSHLGSWQIKLADHHIIVKDEKYLQNMPYEGVILVTGEIENERTSPISETILYWLRENCVLYKIPLLVEADGSRQKPLKAPATHEPPIPGFSETVIVVAGLSAIGKPLTDQHVHRAEIFAQLSGLQIGATISAQALTTFITHPQGGLKNIPPTARRIALLNQADTAELQSLGSSIARELLGHYHSIVVGSLEQNLFHTFENTAAIILAAGQATRFGSPKQLLDWKGKSFVRQIAETALHAGLEPVVVVSGFRSADVESSLKNLPVKIAYNPNYAQGQSTSIKIGLKALTPEIGASIFLLADQPQIPSAVIRSLTEAHTRELSSIIAPLVLEERRANPVLFDRVAFPDLLELTGDVGGRAIFSKHKVEFMPWHDDILLLDVDTQEDYQRLVEVDKL